MSPKLGKSLRIGVFVFANVAGAVAVCFFRDRYKGTATYKVVTLLSFGLLVILCVGAMGSRWKKAPPPRGFPVEPPEDRK